MSKEHKQSGAISGLLIATISLLVLVVVFGSVMIWALVSYFDQKTNVDSKVATAVTAAKKEQIATDEKKFVEREKQPYRDFLGPDDLGNVTFRFPKTWSQYIVKDGTSYEAVFHPDAVAPASSTQPYALRLAIDDVSYETSLAKYQSLIKKGDLKASPETAAGYEGIRLDGAFTNKITDSSMVLFKIRDKTLRLSTEVANYRVDFDGVIIKTLSFNP